MSEDQTPFVHQDGSTTPRRGAPSLRLLSNFSLVAQIAAVRRAGGDDDIPLERAAETLELVCEPVINAVLCTMAELKGDAVILSDIATALLGVGTRRPKLILALRTAIEGVS